MSGFPSAAAGLSLQQLGDMLSAVAGRAARTQMGPLLSLAQRLHPAMPRTQIDRLQVSQLFAQLDSLLTDLQSRVTALDTHQSALHPSNAASQVAALLCVLRLPAVRVEVEAALTAQRVAGLAAQLEAAQQRFEALCTRPVNPGKLGKPAAGAATAPAAGKPTRSFQRRRPAAASAPVSLAKRPKYQPQTKTEQLARGLLGSLQHTPQHTHKAPAAPTAAGAAAAPETAKGGQTYAASGRRARAAAGAAAPTPADASAGLSLAQLRAALQADRLLFDGIHDSAWLRPLKRLAELLHGPSFSEAAVQVPALVESWGVLEQELRQRLSDGDITAGTAGEYARYMAWLLERPEVQQHMQRQQLWSVQDQVDSFQEECRELSSKRKQQQRDVAGTEAAEGAAGAAADGGLEADTHAQQGAAAAAAAVSWDRGAADCSSQGPPPHPSEMPQPPGAGATNSGAGTGAGVGAGTGPGEGTCIGPGYGAAAVQDHTAPVFGAVPQQSEGVAAGADTAAAWDSPGQYPAPSQRPTPSSSDGATLEVSGGLTPGAQQDTGLQQAYGFGMQHASTPTSPASPLDDELMERTPPAAVPLAAEQLPPQAAAASPADYTQPGPPAESGPPAEPSAAVLPVPEAAPPAAAASYTLADLQAAKGPTWAQPFMRMAQLQLQLLGLPGHSIDPGSVQVAGLIRQCWPLLHAELQQGLQDSTSAQDSSSSLSDRAGQAAGWARIVEKVLALQQVQQQLSTGEVQQLQQGVQAAKQRFARLANRLLRRQERVGRQGQAAPAAAGPAAAAGGCDGAVAAAAAAGQTATAAAVGEDCEAPLSATAAAVCPVEGAGSGEALPAGVVTRNEQPAVGTAGNSKSVPAGSDLQDAAAAAAAVELQSPSAPAFHPPCSREVITAQQLQQPPLPLPAAPLPPPQQQQQQQQASVSSLLLARGSASLAASSWGHQPARPSRDPRLRMQQQLLQSAVSSKSKGPHPAVPAPTASLAGPASAFSPAAHVNPVAAAAAAPAAPPPAAAAAPAPAAPPAAASDASMGSLSLQGTASTTTVQQHRQPAALERPGMLAGAQVQADGASASVAGPVRAPAAATPAAAAAAAAGEAAAATPPAAAGMAANPAEQGSQGVPPVSLSMAQRQLLHLYRVRVNPSLDRLLRWKAAMKVLEGCGPGDTKLDQFWHEYEYIKSLAQKDAQPAVFLDAFKELVNTLLPQK